MLSEYYSQKLLVTKIFQDKKILEFFPKILTYSCGKSYGLYIKKNII